MDFLKKMVERARIDPVGMQNELDSASAFNEAFFRTLKDCGGGIYENQSGQLFEIVLENGIKRLTRLITPQEEREIEKNWPKAQ